MQQVFQPQRIALRRKTNVSLIKCSATPVVQKPFRVTNKDVVLAPSDPYQALKGIKVVRASDGEEIELVNQWDEKDVTVVAFARHFGCPFCLELAAQLQRDLLPQLKQQGVKLFLVGIGPRENALKMVESSGFPAEFLFGDKDGECYKALDTYEGLDRTFFHMKTPTVLMERFFKDQFKDLNETTSKYQLSTPNKMGQILTQGALLVMKGNETVWLRYDEATADHASFEEILTTVKQALEN